MENNLKSSAIHKCKFLHVQQLVNTLDRTNIDHFDSTILNFLNSPSPNIDAKMIMFQGLLRNSCKVKGGASVNPSVSTLL